MPESTPLLAPAGSDLLAALRSVTPSEGQARAAFMTWLAAQASGWRQARKLLTRSTWYRHLEALHAVGVPVPMRAYGPKRGAGTSSGACTTLADCHRLVGQPFVVTDAWEPEFYPDGTTGHVTALLFRDGRWCLELAYDGSPGGHEHVPIGKALKRCAFSEGGPDAA